MKKAYVFLSLTFFLTIASCEEDLQAVTNPQQAILGRWEIIGNNFGPISYPGTYTEFRTDNVVFDYVCDDDFSYSQYWIDDSLLYMQSTYYINDGVGYEDTFVSTLPYKFEVLNYNKLRLDLQYHALVTTFIYQRID